MIILGGGIIGLSIAWHLVSTGISKVSAVIESSTFPAATKVAAGMLAPISEASPSNPQLMHLGISSLGLYEEFLASLEKEGISAPKLSSLGTLLVAEDRDGLEWLKKRFAALKTIKADCQWLSRSELQEKEPLLTSSSLAAIHISEEREVLVSELLQALRLGLKKHSVKLLDKEAISLEKKDHWTLSFSDGSQLESDRIVICCGAFLSALGLKKKSSIPSIIPNKGQLVVASPKKGFSLRHMIRTRDVYICPKADGTMRIGASSEYLGREIAPSLGSVREILQDSWKVLPCLDEADFNGVFAGLRPVSNQELPIVKEGEEKGGYWALGHGRSGVLLAPWTAQQIGGMIQR